MIKNITKNIILSKEYLECKTILQKAKGLMLSKPKVLIFPFNKPQIVPLHMWFVFFPIDVLYLDKNKKIVEIIHNFKPFTQYRPKTPSIYIVEFPLGMIKNSDVGDKIEF